MKKVQAFTLDLYHSLPVQLIARQLKGHKLLLSLWLVLLGLSSGLIGGGFGGSFLFLEPEYLGEESFWSVFIVGSALGAFIFAYMITLYINESYRFHFIADTVSPFYTLCYNNFLIPGLFLMFYLGKFTAYHIGVNEGFTWEVFARVSGLLLGIGSVFLLSATYFFANRGLIRWGTRLERGLASSNALQNRQVLLGKAREGLRTPQETDWYILFPFQKVHVDPADHSKLRDIVKGLKQHHGKLLILQVLTFLLIAVLGLLEDRRPFQIPAGASFLLILSLFMMIIGAVDFWFRRSGILTVAVIAGLIAAYNQLGFFHEEHRAFGIDYSHTAPYTPGYIEETSSRAHYDSDREETLAMLENWKKRYQERYGKHAKPTAVLVTASGGGLRSAYWTFNVLQQMDSVTGGRVSDEMRLMTGASGGMFGLSYFRELKMRQEQGQELDLSDDCFAENISQDMLNRIFFKKFTDILLPHRQVSVGSFTYDREAGYSFDRQLVANLPEFRDRRLGDYQAPEYQGIIPTVILTPTILNQGRQLYVSASPVSFLARPNQVSEHYFAKGCGIEFRRFYKDQQPDSLLMSTALRMNATFPFILPVVRLPSKPVMEVMDAGAIDNYGTQTCIRYLFEFREWFEENTAGILVVQIRDNDRQDPIRASSDEKGGYGIFQPLGGGYYSMTESRDMSNDYMLAFMQEWFHGKVEVLTFEYPRETSDQPASLSWHLTRREKQKILASMGTAHNQNSLAALRRMYEAPYPAIKAPLHLSSR